MRKIAIALAISTAITTMPELAAAQVVASDTQAPSSAPDDDAATQGEDIVVTGVRRSLEQARSIKRDTDQFVDAVVAADIGSLPDTNVAESLARVSGVQLDRGVGEGTNIAIRGLRENIILYNGRELFDSTGRGGAGTDELGGSTYGLLALLPSELISRLEVTKLAGSDQITGALGGIVDIHTRKPLDNAGFHLTASGGGIRDDLPGRNGYELFGLISNSFADDRLGVLLSVSTNSRHISEQGLSTFSGYSAFTAGGMRRIGDTDVRVQQLFDDRSKLGGTAVVQWRPDSSFELIADAFYSRTKADRDRYWLAFNPTSALTNAAYSANNVLLSGTSRSLPNTNVSFFDVENDILSLGLSGTYRATDRLKVSAQASVGRSTADSSRNYLRFAPPAGAVAPIDFDFTSGDFGSFNFGNYNLSDPSRLVLALYYDDGRKVVTRNVQARTDATLDFDSPVLASIQAGWRYARLKTTVRPQNALLRPNLPAAGLVPTFATVFSNPDFLPGQFAGVPRDYLAGIESAVGSCRNFTAFPVISQDPACLNPAQSVSSLGNTFDIEEDFLNLYAKANVASDLGFADFSGNFGVRYVGRDLASIGNILRGTTATPTRFDRGDDRFLPSAVAKLTLHNGMIARLGYAKVLTFPSTASLNNGVSLNNDAVFVGGVQIQPGTGSGGSPNLNPYSASQFDVSLEYYFGKEALISVAGFYKDVDSFVVARLSPETYNNTNFTISRATNGQNGKVKGIEVLYQQPFTFLPAPFDGFGALVTYSYIESETPFRDAQGRAFAFPGLSKNNVNLVGYYEKGPLNMRVAYNWRDAYFVSLNGLTGNGVFNDSYKDLAVTLRINVTKAVELRAEGINLLNSQQRTYDGFREALLTNVVYGRVFKVGGSISF